MCISIYIYIECYVYHIIIALLVLHLFNQYLLHDYLIIVFTETWYDIYYYYFTI